MKISSKNIALSAALALAGCTFNVQELTATRELTAPTTSYTTLRARMADAPWNLTRSCTLLVQRARGATTASVRFGSLTSAQTDSIEADASLAALAFRDVGGGALEFGVTMPSGREGLYLAGMTLQVPAGVGVDLSADNCDIDASGVSGAAHLESSNGALTVNTAEAVDLRTSNGGIHGAAGSGGAYTSNGDITLAWIEPTQPLTLETSNGAVRVTIPAHAAITLDLDTSNGSIRLPDGRTRVGTSYRGALLGGGPLLTVDTSNGDIEVLRAP